MPETTDGSSVPESVGPPAVSEPQPATAVPQPPAETAAPAVPPATAPAFAPAATLEETEAAGGGLAAGEPQPAWASPAVAMLPAPFPPPPKPRRALAWVFGIIALVVVLGAAVGVPLALNRAKAPVPATIVPAISTPPPWSGPFLADDIFPEEMELHDGYMGDDLVFELEGSWTHTDDCPSAGRNKESEKFLADCESRIQAVYDSEDGDFRIAYQVFAFSRDETLSWETLGEMPEHFLVTWKAKAEMRDGLWWQLDTVGPFLALTVVGPNGRWTEESSGVSEELVLPAGGTLAEAIKDVMYW